MHRYHGKLDLMYFVPEVFGGHDFGKRVDQKYVDVCCEMYGLHRKYVVKNFKTNELTNKRTNKQTDVNQLQT